MASPHEKAACALRSHKTFGKYIRQTKTGKLRLDKAKIQNEAQYDGKYLISTSDLGISAEDVVLGYKQLHEIERVFKDMKHLIDISQSVTVSMNAYEPMYSFAGWGGCFSSG